MIWLGTLIGFCLFWLPTILTGNGGFFIYDILGPTFYESNLFIVMATGYIIYTLVPSIVSVIILKKIGKYKNESVKKIFLRIFVGINIVLLTYIALVIYAVSRIEIGF